MNSGTASRSWLVISGLGVSKAAINRIITIACLRYFLINSGFKIPIFERKKDTIGNSKTTPAASIVEIIKLKYSSMAMLLLMTEEPKFAKNSSAVGSRTKYAKVIPARKQKLEKITMLFIYLLSLGFRAGSMNFQN